MHVQKLADGRWAGRYKTPDGRHHRTSAHATAASARAAARALEDGRAYAFREGDGADAYYVGRYRLPSGQWAETEDGFDTAEDAVAEARELEQAAAAGAELGA